MAISYQLDSEVGAGAQIAGMRPSAWLVVGVIGRLGGNLQEIAGVGVDDVEEGANSLPNSEIMNIIYVYMESGNASVVSE